MPPPPPANMPDMSSDDAAKHLRHIELRTLLELRVSSIA
jgi:hypothetical protein